MDTHQIDAWATDTFADELVGFAPIIMDPPRVPETGSARVARERRAAERQRRSRVNRARAIESLKTQAELDAAIVGALRTVLARADVASKIRTKDDLKAQRVSLPNVIGEAMHTMVVTYGYDADKASRAVNDKFLRQASGKAVYSPAAQGGLVRPTSGARVAYRALAYAVPIAEGVGATIRELLFPP